ncbi:glycosyltransferase [Patescibacteria group bacterium]|nr:glycosyltransferase [Patescibacteria group bacterium]
MNPKISIVIPTIRENITCLKTIREQTLKIQQTVVIRNIKPNGRARNLGWHKAKEEIIIFIDDDAMLAHNKILANLIDPILKNQADVVGASRRLPLDSNWFARKAASQIPLIETPIVNQLTISNPSLIRKNDADKNIWSPVTTTCCAMRREVLEKTGGFSEKIQWGVDTEFFYRVRKLGYTFAIAPHTWVYHPYASNIKSLWRKYFKSGLGTAQEMKLHPQRKLKPVLKTPLHTLIYLCYRLLVVGALFIVKPFRAFSVFSSTIGYIYGWYSS